MAASSPSRTPFPQPLGQHLPSMHTALAQSSAPAQIRPSAHGEQLPPQSTSVSLPLSTPSAHVGRSQKPVPTLHTAVVQSPPKLQFLPGAHFGHSGPPQSMSVSAPFFIESVQISSPASASEPPSSPAPELPEMAPAPPVAAPAPVPPSPPEPPAPDASGAPSSS
jgi:hypothetical protein